MSVTITLQQPDGTSIAKFPAEDRISLAQMLKNNNVNFPISCGVGMCGICKCKIISGHEYLQIDKISPPIRELQRDDAGVFQEIFACVGGVKTDAIQSTEDHQVILEKYL